MIFSLFISMVFIHLGMRMSRQPNSTAQTIIPECIHHTATTGHLPNAGSMLVHRQQRWYNIESPLVHRHVFVVHTQIAVSPVFVQHRSVCIVV